VLDLAQDHAFARRLVNSGRLSVPAFLTKSALNTPDSDSFAGDMVPGAPMDDAPIQRAGQDAWLLDQLGNRFQLLVFADGAGAVDAATLAQFKSLAGDAIAVEPVVVTPSGGQDRRCHRAGRLPGPGGPPLRRKTRHRLPGPPGPACGRALARL
jgi:3-(3-hydroxy-phenyl)propionate hydroxylase